MHANEMGYIPTAAVNKKEHVHSSAPRCAAVFYDCSCSHDEAS